MSYFAPRPLLLAFVAAVATAAALLAAPAPGAMAHPLGNFTVNRYSRIEIYSDTIRVHYVLDMAEIPAFQEMDSVDADGDGEVSPREAAAYGDAKSAELAANLSLSVGGEERVLTPVAHGVGFPEGQGGLDTLRLSVVFESESADPAGALAYEDRNYSDRLGWKEIVVKPGTGATFGGNAPTNDVSQGLTAYPEDLLSSPSDVTSVAFEFDASTATSAPPVDGMVLAEAPAETQSRAGGGFASLIDRENMTLPVILLALLSALAFGAIHALEPGHGKTLVAAYFVGVKGSARQAVALGGIVAATHSLGVFTIGLVTIFASQWVLPENLYPWLSLASGVMVLFLGLRLIAARGGIVWLRKAAHRVFPHRHAHAGGDDAADASPERPPSWRALVALGLADGLTPSPSALVVLLAAVSLDRVGLGIALIVAFSLGLAMVLAGVSLGLTYARDVADWLSTRIRPAGGAGERLAGLITPDGVMMRVVPVAGALALVAVGALLTARALSQPGLAIF